MVSSIAWLDARSLSSPTSEIAHDPNTHKQEYDGGRVALPWLSVICSGEAVENSVTAAIKANSDNETERTDYEAKYREQPPPGKFSRIAHSI